MQIKKRAKGIIEEGKHKATIREIFEIAPALSSMSNRKIPRFIAKFIFEDSLFHFQEFDTFEDPNGLLDQLYWATFFDEIQDTVDIEDFNDHQYLVVIKHIEQGVLLVPQIKVIQAAGCYDEYEIEIR